MTTIQRAGRALTIAVLGVAALARPARAHPIHTTLTVVTPNATGARFMLRAFADDFSAVVARYAGKPAPTDSSALPADVQRYVSAHLAAVDANGKALALVSCGIRRERELYWICVRLDDARGLAGVRLQNRVLTDLHPDQVNIVQVDGANGRRTTLFTKDTPLSSVW
jgi:hypothetical protein